MNFSDTNGARAAKATGTAVKFLIGILAGVICAGVLALLFALIMTVDAVPDASVSIFAYVIMAVSAAVCGFVSVLGIGRGGLVNGLLSGIILFALQTILGLLFSGLVLFSAETLIHFAVDIVFATAGGVAAVNLKR